MEERRISDAVIKRLPRYFRYLQELQNEGEERISGDCRDSRQQDRSSRQHSREHRSSKQHSREQHNREQHRGKQHSSLQAA